MAIGGYPPIPFKARFSFRKRIRAFAELQKNYKGEPYLGRQKTSRDEWCKMSAYREKGSHLLYYNIRSLNIDRSTESNIGGV